jgi:hypothetical protein
MTQLTIYGDFNCPFSALASARADTLLALGHKIDWRAVQHDPTIPSDGEVIEGAAVADLVGEVEEVRQLGGSDVDFCLVVPSVRPNTAAACAAFATAGENADLMRRRLFAAVWVEGINVGDRAELDRLGVARTDEILAGRWQHEFDALPAPITPTLVLPDGYVSRGLGALTRLAAFVESGHQP